jgi:hypothetical protein
VKRAFELSSLKNVKVPSDSVFVSKSNLFPLKSEFFQVIVSILNLFCYQINLSRQSEGMAANVCASAVGRFETLNCPPLPNVVAKITLYVYTSPHH